MGFEDALVGLNLARKEPHINWRVLTAIEIGSEFAMQEAILAVAVLFQKFDFKLKDPNFKITWKQTLTLKPHDLFMYAKLRSGIDPLSLQRDLFLGSGGDASFSPVNEKVAENSNMEGDLVPMSIFYGSNTGTCESLASRLAMTALQHGFKSSVKPLDEAKNNMQNDRPVVIITSTMYEGQAPGKYPHTEGVPKSNII